MGFNKRFINRESLTLAKNQGIDYLINYVRKPDSLIIQDEFSEKICHIILNEDKKNICSQLLSTDLWT